MLDINTPKGQKTLIQERRLQELIKIKYPKYDIIETPKEESAPVDLFLYNKSTRELCAIAECKCRVLDQAKLRSYGSLLITNQKLIEGQILSAKFFVPFYVFVYCTLDESVFMWPITNSKGRYRFSFPIKDSLTRKNVNGGEIIRSNAYLPVEQANFFLVP